MAIDIAASRMVAAWLDGSASLETLDFQHCGVHATGTDALWRVACEHAIQQHTEVGSQCVLGTCLYLGLGGMRVDEQRALVWLERAAASARSEPAACAEYLLGVHTMQSTSSSVNGQNLNRCQAAAIKRLMSASARGHAAAQYALGVLHFNAADEHKGAEYFALAAECKHYAEAEFALGHCYVLGRGVASSEARASALFARAAAQGHTGSLCALARCFLDGVGVARDAAHGINLLTQAAARGHADAQYELGCLLSDADEPRAVLWWRQAAARQHARALAELVRRGIMVPRPAASPPCARSRTPAAARSAAACALSF